MKEVLLVKYGEIAMRGKNRRLVENRLIKIIQKNISSVGNYNVIKEQGRFIIESDKDKFDYDKTIPYVINIPGITAVCLGIRLKDQSIENIRKNALEHMKMYFSKDEFTFKVETKRSDKRYPLDSRQVSADVGGYVFNNMKNSKVDVHNPQVLLMVELRNNAYIYSKLIHGVGGLPVGSSGKALLLMSGGIDSPVAGFLAAKRGTSISAVYFDSPPYTSERAKQKVKDIAERLCVFTGGIKLYVVPFTDVQLYLYDNVPEEKITIFLKRAMLKTAEKIAVENNYSALITGDSIGQVASQTLPAINAINSVAKDVVVLRPLLGLDKQEIVDIAKKIGTFEISIRPYEDCCTVFVAKHPETKPKKSIIESIELKLDNLDNLILDAKNNCEIIEF